MRVLNTETWFCRRSLCCECVPFHVPLMRVCVNRRTAVTSHFPSQLMPLAYRTGDRFSALLTLYGSALPYAGVPALFSAALTLTLNLAVPRDYLLDIFRHPYPFQPFAYIAAFVLVFYQRGVQSVLGMCVEHIGMGGCQMGGDAVVEALTFDELPIGPATGEEGTSTASMQALTQRRAFRRCSSAASV